MSEQQVQFERITPNLSKQILQALRHFESEVGQLEIVSDGAMSKDGRLYVPIRPVNQPPTMFSFYHAVAGAELELRDSGLDIQLTPEYRQRFVVVARVHGQSSPYIYDSEEGAEYDDLSRLLELGPKWEGDSATIESYPFDGPEDRDIAWKEALAEHPTAKELP